VHGDPMSGGQTEKQVQLIRDFAPEIIMVTPSYMLAILDEFRRQGVDPRSTSLRIGIFGAEPWGDGIRAEIESAFGIDACDIYGLSEVMGPGVAQEFAGTKQGPTIWEDHFIAEIVDPDGRPVADGEPGELVFTSLTKEAMPIIRYRTRDLTRLLPGTVTKMRRMARISGRTDDMLIIRGVNVFPSQIEELILRCEGLAPHFAIEVTRPNRLDEISIVVEAGRKSPMMRIRRRVSCWPPCSRTTLEYPRTFEWLRAARCRAQPARPTASRTAGSGDRVRMPGILIAVMLALGCGAACRAQQPPAVMDDVVVTGERTGPGMWHVHRGAAQVWILGSMSPLPKGITWRSKQVEQVLDGTSQVLVQKPFEIGIARILWLLITERSALHGSRRQAAQRCAAAGSARAVCGAARQIHRRCGQVGAIPSL
jgi:hypothetical protein